MEFELFQRTFSEIAFFIFLTGLVYTPQPCKETIKDTPCTHHCAENDGRDVDQVLCYYLGLCVICSVMTMERNPMANIEHQRKKRKVFASNGGGISHVTCVGERSGSSPGLSFTEPSALPTALRAQNIEHHTLTINTQWGKSVLSCYEDSVNGTWCMSYKKL